MDSSYLMGYAYNQNRVVGQIRDERDFHIFYQFTKGASPEQQGELLALP
jgi:myosin-1